jgi:4,5-DOPA dioxygenase extradiol
MELMPVLFIGHGNPMNAIENNEFSKEWEIIANEIPEPKAILSVSAHWITRGTWVTTMEKPETIHDFSGFPQELFNVQYPASGSPEFAKLAQNAVRCTNVQADKSWGLDHGTWSVLAKMYPKANIPTFQLSIDFDKPAAMHYQIGKELTSLRKQGVLILGSGNIVHNLGRISWSNETFDWADKFDKKIVELIKDRKDDKILDYQKMGEMAGLSVPTTDHFYPLLYVLGASEKKEPIKVFNEKTTMGSISMTSILIGN